MQTTNYPNSPILSSGSVRGSDVITPDGAPIGTVRELIIDQVDMRVVFAIVDFGAAAQGLPEQQIALPIELLEADSENHRFILRLPLSPAAQSFPGEAPVDAFDLEPPEIMPFRYQGNPHRN